MKPAIILFFFALATVSSALLFDTPQDEYRNIEIVRGENINVNLDTAAAVDIATKRLTSTWDVPNDDSIRDSPKNKGGEDFSYTEESEEENPLSTPLGLGIIIVSSILMVGAIVLAVTYREKPTRQTEESKTVPAGAAEDDMTEKERSEFEERELGEGSTGGNQGV